MKKSSKTKKNSKLLTLQKQLQAEKEKVQQAKAQAEAMKQLLDKERGGEEL